MTVSTIPSTSPPAVDVADLRVPLAVVKDHPSADRLVNRLVDRCTRAQ